MQWTVLSSPNPSQYRRFYPDPLRFRKLNNSRIVWNLQDSSFNCWKLKVVKRPTHHHAALSIPIAIFHPDPFFNLQLNILTWRLPFSIQVNYVEVSTTRRISRVEGEQLQTRDVLLRSAYWVLQYFDNKTPYDLW